MSCSNNTSNCGCPAPTKDQIISVLDELNVVYTDNNGVIQGDCGMCAGSGNNITANTVAFNPGNNQLTTVVNGIASSTTLAFDTGDIVTSGALTVGGVLYPAGTILHTVLAAIVAISHPAASVNLLSNVALTVNVGSQVFNLDLSASGSYDNSLSGLAATSIQGAIDELKTLGSSLPTGTIGQILINNGTTYVPAARVTVTLVNQTTSNITLPTTPIAFAPFDFFRNGQLQIITTDFTRSGANISLTVGATTEETFTAVYYG